MIDAVIIGGGINGLVTGALLSRQRLSTLVLERQPLVGGGAATFELAPGFRVPRLSHTVGPLQRDLIRALRLDRIRTLEFLTPDPALTTLGSDGAVLAFHPDAVLTAAAINAVSAHDAGRWREFLRMSERIAHVAADLGRRVPPALDSVTLAERWQWLRTGRRVQRLGRETMARGARWVTMPIAEVLDEWFEHDLLKAAIAARAIFGNLAGPRSPGTGGSWLQQLAADPSPVGSGMTVRGGPGALAGTLVEMIEAARGQVRTGVRVARILTRADGVTGVALDTGEEIDARVVVSAVDPRQTFLQLVDNDALAPGFLEKVRQLRARGVTAKINLALSALPNVPALSGDPVALRGRLLIAPATDYLERAFDAAKYGDFSPAPWLEVTIPSVLDPTLAPEGQHVMSMYVQFAPRHLRHSSWSEQREALYSTAMRALEPYMPGLEPLILAREILTPEDLEREWGLSGGHIFHGETALDQTWVARPLLGWARYATPIPGLFLASGGTHPGGGFTGASGRLAAGVVAEAIKKRS